ncbi:GNAT family N-acetyltransferase [Baekduia soli]|uniref:GNAT family N-acetyltransferase n=1 Tax=Baekduia soli TaxID=496014 RepID=UPI001651D015|nr:GNAT family N-acetyltransferase [Baekduia soli]
MASFPLPDPELRDERVRLRPPALRDAAALTEACRDPDIRHWTFVPSPYGPEHAHGWIDGAAAAREAGEELRLVIASADDDAVLGTTGLLRPRWEHRSAEIGYLVAPWARGRGVATRSTRLLSRWALGAMGLARVTLEIAVDNAASRRVSARAGFVEEGVLQSVIEEKGRHWTLAVSSLLPEDLA